MIENLECRRFRNRIDAFVDNELSSSEKEEMLRHAEQCPECGKLLKEYRDMLDTLRIMDEDIQIPTEAAQAWRSAVRDEAEHTRRIASRGWIRALSTVAAVFVVLLGVTSLYRRGYHPNAAGNVTTGAAYDYHYDTDTMEMEADALYATSPASETYDYGSGSRSVTEEGQSRSMVLESDGVVTAAGAGIAQESSAEVKPIILRSATRRMETVSFDEDSASIDVLVSDYQGWFASRSLYGKPFGEGGSGRTLDLSIRIPTETMDDFLLDLKQIGTTVRITDLSEDVSLQYYDYETRLNALRAQHERLMELITDAADLSDLIDLEEKLYDVQAQIDFIEGTLRDLDSRVQYAEISVTLEEVREYTEPDVSEQTLVQRIHDGFYSSIRWIKQFLQDMLVAIATFSPSLVVIVPAIVILWLIIRALRKRHKRKY